MKQTRQQDAGFEQYRRERKMRRVQQAGESTLKSTRDNHVTKQIEAAEAMEARDQRLTREVHEFFSDATRTAANIVEKVSAQASEDHVQKVSTEVEQFLQDAIRRAQSFIDLLRRNGPCPEAEKILEAQMQNLVGPLLDSFRSEGTASVADKHVGQDPFLSEVPSSIKAEPKVDLDEHKVAEAASKPASPAAGPLAPATRARGAAKPGAAKPPAKGAAKAKSGPAAHPLLAGIGGDRDKLKKALRLLVDGGIMNRDEAEEIWKQGQ